MSPPGRPKVEVRRLPQEGFVSNDRPPGSAKFPLRLGALTPVAKVLHGGPPQPATGPVSGVKPRPVAAARPLLRPQHHLQHAHADASRRVAASGVGLDSPDVRRGMTAKLRAAGVCSDRVLAAMASVPRHRFVDAALVTQAYEDTSLPIGHGQTISKPSVVARMIELLLAGTNARRDGHLGRVLEIGTGCGYQALVLAALGRHVISIERLKPLHDKARELLAPLRPPHLRLVHADGMLGHLPNAPYDSIIAAAGGDALPDAWLTQLAVGGRLVSPVRRPGSSQQVLMVVDRTEHGWDRSVHEAVHFVPLKSGLVLG